MEMEDIEDNSEVSALGVMFDSHQEREMREIRFEKLPINDSCIKCFTIGDDPGHLQSGHYLWPAAEFASNYLISNWEYICPSIDCRVLELGSGCGLLGMVASRLPGVKYIAFSDYDSGCLRLIEENARINCKIPYDVEFLQWGSKSSLKTHSFDLIVGSDLIYSKDIVLPLFKSVQEYICLGCRFYLISSFDIGEEIENIVNNTISDLGMIVVEVLPLDLQQKQCRVQYFQIRDNLGYDGLPASL